MAFTGTHIMHGAAEPVSKKILEAYKDAYVLNGEEWLLKSENKNKFIKGLKKIQKSRFSGINFGNVEDEYDKINNINTIEFRLPNGTIDADTWIENINLFGGLLSASQELSDIQKKAEYELTDADIEKLEVFRKIKNSDTDKISKLKYLLELTIRKEDRQIYEERYFINKELLNKNEETNNNLNKYISEEPIILDGWRPTVYSIGKYCYSKDNPFGKPVNSESLVNNTMQRLGRDLRETKKEINDNIDISNY